METVQLQCGHCHRIMAISTEHLGGQVQCPHCRSVVQTPPRSTPPAPPPAPPPPAFAPPPAPPKEANQRESIFTGPEPTDDVFGAPANARVEMPQQPAPDVPPMFQNGAPASPSTETAAAQSDADLTQFKRRPIYDKGTIMLSVMIFLVPYSILATLFIIYLLFTRSGGGGGDPLKYLPDPASMPKQGGPQKITMLPKHDLPLAASQVTKLKQPIQIGDLIVTPEKVRWNEDGDLQLFLRARNNSKKTRFEPINDMYVRYTPNKAGSEIFTFLESKSKNTSNIYGAYLNYYKNFAPKAEHAESVIGPRDEAHIVLTTTENYRTSHLAGIAKGNDEFLWRVHVRRGFVEKRGGNVSATAVIGVEFSSAEIERDAKKS